MEQVPTPEASAAPIFVSVGDNPARVFGLDADTRARRLAAKAKLECAGVARPGQAVLLADLDYTWDPAWLGAIAKRPGAVLMLGDRAVLAHVPAHQDSAPMIAAMAGHAPWTGGEFDRLDAETTELNNHELRKRERPFVLKLDAANPEPVERAAYDASYKGVTDALTLYLWRRPAFHLTRWAAKAGMTPNQITLVGAILCVTTSL